MQSRTDVVRARWQLWAVTFSIIGSLAGVLIYLATTQGQLPDLTFIPSRAILGIGLGGFLLAFLIYAIDRERNLHRLAEQLVAEQLESDRLATRLQYLSELARERDTNEALLEGSADGIAVVDRDLVVVRFNAAMARLCGTDIADALGAHAEEVLRFASAGGDPLEGIDYPLRAVLADREPRAGTELQLVLPDGTTQWVGGTFSPIHDTTDNSVPLVLVTVRDIGEQKEQERMQRDFVSMAAHELRSPLTAIKGFARTLVLKHDQLTPERRAEYLSVVNEQSNRLARLVDDLMQVSRIDANRVKLEFEEIELPEMVRALVEHFRAKWSDRRIDVRSSDLLPPALADRHKLEEVLINLIDNAIKYSPAGSPVEVRIAPSRDGLEVAVRDHGAGIAAEDLPHLFQKFQRLPEATAADIPGTGLGLYIVKGLVEAHGGRVWADSEPGAGSTFRFTVRTARDRVAVRSANA